MIIRSTTRQRFTTLPNETLGDSRLSWKARGLLAYLLSKPNGWTVRREQLIQSGPDGKTAVDSGLKELEEAGYMERERYRDDDGRFSYRTVVYDSPKMSENPAPENRPPENRPPENPALENETLVNTDVVNTDQVNTDQVNTEEGSCEPGGSRPQADWRQFVGAYCWMVHGHDKVETLTEQHKGMLLREANTVWKMGHDIDSLRLWWKDVWENDWRWQKNKQRPTTYTIRTSIEAIRAETPEGFFPKPKQTSGSEAVDRLIDRMQEKGQIE